MGKPNNECAEACLSTELQKVTFNVITGFQGKSAGNETAPCPDHGFHAFNRTDVIGAGPIKISLDKYLPDKSLFSAKPILAKNKCALACSVKAIGVYWACAAVCIKEDAPNSCITAGCLAATGAFDVSCLKACPNTSEVIV